MPNIIFFIHRHWVAVFGLIVDTSLRTSCVEKLIKYVRLKSKCKCVDENVHNVELTIVT